MSNNSFTRKASLAVAFALILSYAPAHSFVPVTPSSSTTSTSTSINIFGGLADAFKSDDSLGKAQNAGLSNGPKYNENVTVNGKPIKNIVVDQKISQVCATARVKVPYNCQNGECGTCTVKLNGRKARACVTKVPGGKCAIQTL
mmetsp:Transcript_14280/g.30492  ORF Transcript_14280/g.30492 Transcript_14280/m.30492 type:complete len:144 (-) Transcript_14280:299-730(-)|eukprot:CAMPEP_0196135496 /NCGR_PEP_ID=MMETSP0910-20130528/4118_1 /TAXON_ID=49265 /ORGANISM="Thalassiosira rotula, Strain GSO102" /LENGTH=143 /DNA_ID=CAMNT_0041395649 /DNA_START=112 /DNA_END=543 /DNA_ORIENTATION=+